MLRALVALLALSVAAPAFALSEDGLGFALSTDGPIVVHTTTSAPFQQVTVYLCAYKPQYGGVAGWEASIDVDGDALAGAWTLPAGLDVDGSDEGFQVGIGYAPAALMMNAADLVHLATWTGLVPSSESVTKFYIEAVAGSTSFTDGAGYYGPNSSSEAATFTTPGNYVVQDLQINGVNDAFQEATWSAVKQTYR
ncbi:MAG TPA: hypothetical protein P5571_09070 [Candidatus Krumholzibacteria bacterium]|nr:hypothetical protein [Candidatus Krumholzibacteria bacterium]